MTLHSFGLEWLLASKFNNTCQFLYFLYSCNCILENCIFPITTRNKEFKKGCLRHEVFFWFSYTISMILLHVIYVLFFEFISKICHIISTLFIVNLLQGLTLRNKVPCKHLKKFFRTCCNKIYVIRVFI